uniref:Uncharacterized protein n=1 Tax=Steinernema glaseri TaxID=37863 RepID=A0A1I8AIF7_9BILA
MSCEFSLFKTPCSENPLIPLNSRRFAALTGVSRLHLFAFAPCLCPALIPCPLHLKSAVTLALALALAFPLIAFDFIDFALLLL